LAIDVSGATLQGVRADSASGSESSGDDVVGLVLKEYGERGLFSRISKKALGAGDLIYSMSWAHGRDLQLRVVPATHTLWLPNLLPCVSEEPLLRTEFPKFLQTHRSTEMPLHRRFDRRKSVVRCIYRGGSMSVKVVIKDGDYAYALRKLIHLAQEVHQGFLSDGPYQEYRVRELGVNPDKLWML
jgi:hypothetical protein